MPRHRKPSGRPGPAAPKVHKRAYRFDRSRSLSELSGWPSREPRDDAGLVGRYEAATHRPVGQLDDEQLVLLFTQGTDPHYLAPVAIDLLRAGLSERLLLCVLRLTPEFWRDRPALERELLELLARLEPRLASMDDQTRFEARWFVERRRPR